MQESIPLVVALLSFGAVTALAFVFGQYVWVQSRIQRRLSAPAHTFRVAKARPPRALDAFVTKHFDEKRFGVDETLRGKLRRELVRAAISETMPSIITFSPGWQSSLFSRYFATSPSRRL